MATVEAEGRDFTIENLQLYLSIELQKNDHRILSVTRLERKTANGINYRLEADSEGVTFSIGVAYLPSGDSFAVYVPLRDHANCLSQEGVGRFLHWWDEYEGGRGEALHVDFSLLNEDQLILIYNDEASAYYLEIIDDLIQEMLDVAPSSFRKLNEIFGENP